MVKELDCVGKSERHLFSAVLAFLSLSNISEDFDLTFLQTFFYPITFANNYFVFLDPQKKFSKFLFPPSRKIIARPLRCSYHVREASTLCLDHLITRIFFLVGKSHFLFYQNSYLPYVIKYPFKVFSGQC